jgi:hypothetical protein
MRDPNAMDVGEDPNAGQRLQQQQQLFQQAVADIQAANPQNATQQTYQAYVQVRIVVFAPKISLLLRAFIFRFCRCYLNKETVHNDMLKRNIDSQPSNGALLRCRTSHGRLEHPESEFHISRDLLTQYLCDGGHKFSCQTPRRSEVETDWISG